MAQAPYQYLSQCYIKLTNCELHYYYYSVTQDMVRAIRQSAELLEADGTSAYGISFKTRWVGCVPWALNSSNYNYDHAVPGSITKRIYVTTVDRWTTVADFGAAASNGILAHSIAPQFAPGGTVIAGRVGSYELCDPVTGSNPTIVTPMQAYGLCHRFCPVISTFIV